MQGKIQNFECRFNLISKGNKGYYVIYVLGEDEKIYTMGFGFDSILEHNDQVEKILNAARINNTRSLYGQHVTFEIENDIIQTIKRMFINNVAFISENLAAELKTNPAKYIW